MPPTAPSAARLFSRAQVSLVSDVRGPPEIVRFAPSPLKELTRGVRDAVTEAILSIFVRGLQQRWRAHLDVATFAPSVRSLLQRPQLRLCLPVLVLVVHRP
jgi:hypothetical protein